MKEGWGFRPGTMDEKEKGRTASNGHHGWTAQGRLGENRLQTRARTQPAVWLAGVSFSMASI